MREINRLSIHEWLRSAIPDSQKPTSPIGFLFLKLPPPPCAVYWYYIFIFLCVFTKNWTKLLLYKQGEVIFKHVDMSQDILLYFSWISDVS